ncbi:MAG TPA: glutamate racemase [Candidatus Paceibacterota bacterium]
MIGVFDSGFGGLSVFRELIRSFPKYDFVYLGDNARYPYGDRSGDAVFRFTREATAWLFREGCELVILACNTASAQALRRLQQEWLPGQAAGKKVLGVLVPVAEAVAQNVRAGERVGIIATRGTVHSNAYPRELAKHIPAGIEVIQQACPLFVPLVEEGLLEHPITEAVAYHYLAPLSKRGITKLILGCTHYPFLFPTIQKVMGGQCQLFDSGPIVAKALAQYCEKHKALDIKIRKTGLRRYLTTDDPVRFNEFAQKAAGLFIEAEKLDLVEFDRV